LSNSKKSDKHTNLCMRKAFQAAIITVFLVSSRSFLRPLRSFQSKFYCSTRLIAAKMGPKRTVEDSVDENPTKQRKVASTEVAGNSETLPCVPDGFQLSRARLLTKKNREVPTGNCVVLWMSRDQRVFDNHAFHYAQSVARTHNIPLRVVFNLVPRFLEATLRQYGFMIKGLQEVEVTLRGLHIPFHLLMGDPLVNLPQFVKDQNAVLLVADFSPLRVGLNWVTKVAETLDEDTSIPLVQIDAHNVVPCWAASPKLEYAARTIRSKIMTKLPEYVRGVPDPLPNPDPSHLDATPIDWNAALASLQINRDVLEVDWLQPGYIAAQEMLASFITERLAHYATKRNDPNESVASNLSPYLHFGHISAEKILLVLKAQKKAGSNVDSFVEELIVRRELADNFCFYNPLYDSLEGCADWAQESLQQHRNDPRPVTYTREQLEAGMTQDDLWNAAQLQMTREGKMHVCGNSN
jgi:deoxyribodipyrimidine photo-lyase